MKPVHHVIISTSISTVFWFLSKDLPATAACFFSHIFIDTDHHLEYIFTKKKFPWSLRKLSAFFDDPSYRKVFLVFHAWEYLLILWLTIFALDLNLVWVGLAIGLTTHIIADELYNPIRPMGYFIIFRMMLGFDKEKLRSDF